jgi:hypothetical protein
VFHRVLTMAQRRRVVVHWLVNGLTAGVRATKTRTPVH